MDEVHTFTSSGTLVLDKQAVGVRILVIAGGGGGSGDSGGGGGAGGVVYDEGVTLEPGSYTIIVGVGGNGAPGRTSSQAASINIGNNGGNSSISLNSSVLYLSYGGGAGAANEHNGNAGGSGIVIVRFAYQPVSQLGFLSFKPRRNREVNLITSYVSEQNSNFLTCRTPRAFKTSSQTVNYDFNYTGNIESFTVPFSGIYKLEVWGAQGGDSPINSGGYGGYSCEEMYLSKNQQLFIVVGGKGANGTNVANTWVAGGYNGGGYGWQSNALYASGGGGATHITTKTGLLSTLGSDIDKILIVAGGGAGGYEYSSKTFTSNSGGGFKGG